MQELRAGVHCLSVSTALFSWSHFFRHRAEEVTRELSAPSAISSAGNVASTLPLSLAIFLAMLVTLVLARRLAGYDHRNAMYADGTGQVCLADLVEACVQQWISSG